MLYLFSPPKVLPPVMSKSAHGTSGFLSPRNCANSAFVHEVADSDENMNAEIAMREKSVVDHTKRCKKVNSDVNGDNVYILYLPVRR